MTLIPHDYWACVFNFLGKKIWEIQNSGKILAKFKTTAYCFENKGRSTDSNATVLSIVYTKHVYHIAHVYLVH